MIHFPGKPGLIYALDFFLRLLQRGIWRLFQRCTYPGNWVHQ